MFIITWLICHFWFNPWLLNKWVNYPLKDIQYISSIKGWLHWLMLIGLLTGGAYTLGSTFPQTVELIVDFSLRGHIYAKVYHYVAQIWNLKSMYYVLRCCPFWSNFNNLPKDWLCSLYGFSIGYIWGKTSFEKTSPKKLLDVFMLMWVWKTGFNS